MPLSLNLNCPVSFEPVGKVTHVFYDDKNKQVFSVRSGGATGMMSRGFIEDHVSTFRLEDQGPIVTIKLSPDQKILAIQRTKNSVQFIGVKVTGANGILDQEGTYVQAVKNKNAVLLGFSWLSNFEIAFFCDTGVELYKVLDERKMLKNVRSHTEKTAWFVFCSQSDLLVISSAQLTSNLQLFSIKNGYVYKVAKIDFNSEVREKDVSLFSLYNNSYLSVIQHLEEKEIIKISIYLLCKETSSVTKTFVLTVPVKGNISLSTVDNLILVHHQPTATSYICDIAIPGDFDGTITHLTPICSARIKPSATTSADEFPSSASSLNTSYSINWISFQPNVIIDAKTGFLWKLELSLDCDSIMNDIPEVTKLVPFLQQRDGAKLILLDIILILCRKPDMKLSVISSVFDLLNQQYKNHLDNMMQKQMGIPTLGFPSPATAFKTSLVPAAKPVSRVLIDQADLFTHLFSVLAEEDQQVDSVISKNTFFILMEYFKSLNDFQISAQHFLDELLINLLVRRSSWFQLHQLLQYHVISDSKPIACLLLSLGNVYRPAHQLALDMLYRLGNSSEEIVEILLSNESVTSALKFVQKESLDYVPMKKFLQSALESGDTMLFYNIFTFCQGEKSRQMGNGYEVYKSYFSDHFG